jgi:putative SOS response-associated peptidase YedK
MGIPARLGGCAKVPMMINSRLDKANTSTWKGKWKSTRVIVPADGWYEWVTLEAGKQPYFITPIDGQPLFFAALSSVRPGAYPQDGDGFVLVTDAAEAGMLDVHDRRPLVLSAQDAHANG